MGQQIQKQQKAIEQEPDHHRRRLPLEMENEIFKFLKWPIQLKLIASMGRGIYGLFQQRLMVKVCFCKCCSRICFLAEFVCA
jgi:hypothetical protein